MTPAAAIVDVRGMTCSDAVVRLHKSLAPLSPGSTVRVVAAEEEVLVDLRKYAARGGHRWSGERRAEGGVVEAEVHRGE